MNTRRKRILLNQNNMVKVVPQLVATSGISLEEAIELLKQGHTAKYIICNNNMLPIDKVALYKEEIKLLTIDPKANVFSTVDNKPHELRFITRINEFKNSIDPIADEIKGIFRSNRSLKQFAYN